MIEKSEGAIVITGSDVNRFRLLALRGALRLETKGLRHSRGSVCAVVKREFGLKGSKQKVLEQFEAVLRERGIIQ